MVASDAESPSLPDWHTGLLADLDEQAQVPRTRRRRFLDGFLFLIEIFAVVGVVIVLFNGLSLWQELNREVASGLVQPTLSPTPLITAAILPSGHTPPTSPGGSQFNESEIPAHLRPQVQSFNARVPVPTAGPEQAVRIQIPTIQVNQQIVQGDGWEQLKKGVGQHPGTANPGEKGNVVLSAHNDIFGEIFRRLDELVSGDEVILYTNQRAYTYVVVDKQVVEPTKVEVMAPSSQPTVTLISCYPYLVDNMRIVVTARLKSSGS